MLSAVLVLLLLCLLFVFPFLGPWYWRYRKNKKYPISEEEMQRYFNENDLRREEKVRKQWLLTFFFCLSLNFLSLLGIWLAASEELRPYILSETGGQEFGIILPLTLVLICSLIFYHCAYRKRGTVLLMLCITTMPFKEYQLIRSQNLSLASIFSLELGVLLFFVGTGLWLWVNCIRLRKVNAFRKCQIKLARKNKYFQKVLVLSI